MNLILREKHEERFFKLLPPIKLVIVKYFNTLEYTRIQISLHQNVINVITTLNTHNSWNCVEFPMRAVIINCYTGWGAQHKMIRGDE